MGFDGHPWHPEASGSASALASVRGTPEPRHRTQAGCVLRPSPDGPSGSLASLATHLPSGAGEELHTAPANAGRRSMTRGTNPSPGLRSRPGEVPSEAKRRGAASVGRRPQHARSARLSGLPETTTPTRPPMWPIFQRSRPQLHAKTLSPSPT